ncbi:Tc toxin subunit A [Pseudomonas baltica]|uniref:Virulence plasmid A protein n=1 Tax=Pseudomonas baltica TaxID=2762576 RepID=A0A7X1KT52_9PSED|nr:Tc toxin subunit A [Pseudomonas baltica]MBC2678268.1 hypothetical protein [Pseudomonas baltica]
MNTPELPDPVFDDGDHLPAEVELPELADPTPNPLFDNLVPLTPENHLLGRMSFADAMPEMGMSSVFDIIRQPKAEFTRQLRTLSDADGELAYDNALCYATQIARSYREDIVSSGRNLPLIAPQTGVRALVDIGPSYPNLFKENWDQFCKVGAIEAMDGPVAYLGSLRRFAEQKIEGASTSPLRIPLAVRRPDLDSLVIDEQSTYQSVPMLDLVNNVLSQGIAKYQTEKGDARPIHELLAEKKHPFVFPYHFAHQQVSLALAGDKPQLGEINHKLSLTVPVAQPKTSRYSHTQAQQLLSGLSPAQQKLLTAPSLFPTFTINAAELDRALNPAAAWISPAFSTLYPYENYNLHLLVPNQEGVVCTPAAVASGNTKTNTLIQLSVRGAAGEKVITLTACMMVNVPGAYSINYNHVSQKLGSRLHMYLDPSNNPGLVLPADYSATFIVNVGTNVGRQPLIAQWRICIDLSAAPRLDDLQQRYFTDHLGVVENSVDGQQLADTDRFCGQTGIDAEQLEALIARKSGRTTLSPNCLSKHATAADSAPARRLPNPSHHAASYINAGGAMDACISDDRRYNNAIDLIQREGSQRWILVNISPDRLDRMQRMIRLQRWLDIPFAELDTLIIAAMRGEYGSNPARELNANTLRCLGVFRYFNQHHGMAPDEFAAFMDDLCPFATQHRSSLFDRVFNTPMLFGTPLVLDHNAFDYPATPTSSKTINQLCAGLGVEPDAQSFGLMVAAARINVASVLRRTPLLMGSLYRQARCAQLFGMSIAECQQVLRLLGGEEYVNTLAKGKLLPRLDTGNAPADILDILMELDWVARWAAINKLTVTGLLALLDTGDAQEPATALLERLQQMADEARTLAVNAATISALGLPNKATGAAIDWHMELGKGTSAIIDAAGLVKPLQPTLTDTDQQQLAEKVRSLVASLGLAASDVQIAEDTLNTYLANALCRQQRLVEGLLQEHTTLLPELAVWVAHCADVSPYRLLERTLQAWPINTEPDAAKVSAVLADLRQIGTCARAVSWAKVGAAALRTFVVNPAWLGCDNLWPLSLNTLHLLKAYDSLFNTLGQPEERLLGYVQQANALVSRRPGKRQLAVQSQTCNAALASLLGWSESEVAMLTALLPQQTAKTVAHIDWVRRAQALSLETGLDAATLLKACSLNADSPEADWQTVGQAAMAAVSR